MMFIEDTHEGRADWESLLNVEIRGRQEGGGGNNINKNWLCKVLLIRRKLKCSGELQVFLTHWIRFSDSRLLEAPHSFSRYSAEIVHIHNTVTFSFWFHLTAFWLHTTFRLRPQIEDPRMVGMTALEVLNLTPIVLLPSRLHWWISANKKRLSLTKIIAWLSPRNSCG